MALKRCLDTTLSSLLLVALSPVFVAIGIAIWLDSGRPLLFHQNRVGLNFRPFCIMKFRTMWVVSGPLLTVANDDRITRIGKLLRLTKLDELPQFWNVLRGDMSLVGPRPEVPDFVELFRERYAVVLRVRPGITDLASIHFRNEEAVLFRSADPHREYVEHILPAKLTLAEQYVATHTVWGDISILLKTAMAIIRGN